jgi:hypothetical protein
VSDIDSANITATLVLNPATGVLTGGGFALTAIPENIRLAERAGHCGAGCGAVRFRRQF